MTRDITSDELKALETAKEQHDIAFAAQAVDHAKTHLQSVIAQLGNHAPPSLSSALQALSSQTVTTVGDALNALALANKAEETAKDAEGREMLADVGGTLAGFAGLAGLLQSDQVRESFRKFGEAIGTDNQSIQNLDRSALFAGIRSGVTQDENSRDISQTLGM